jgi:hypothetical protein
VAAVVVISVVISTLVALFLINRGRALMLVEEMKVRMQSC